MSNFSTLQYQVTKIDTFAKIYFKLQAEESFYFVKSGSSDFLMQKFKELVGEHTVHFHEVEVVMGRNLQVCPCVYL